MKYQGRLETAEDIRQKAVTEETVDGQKRVRIVCGPATDDVEAFGMTINPDWPSYRASQLGNRGGFYGGTNSYSEAVNLLRNGWPEGTEKMRGLISKLSPKLPTSQRVKMRYQGCMVPHGAFNVDPVALKTGMPDKFIGSFRTNQTVQGSKIIRIAFNATVSAGMSTSIIEGRGAACLALVDTLTKLRKTVDLTIFYCVNADYKTYWLGEWHVKPAGMTVNTDQLAFSLVHPASFRRMMFAMAEHTPGKSRCRSFSGGYGSIRPLRTLFPDVAKDYDLIVDSDVYVKDGQVRVEWSDPTSQIEWIKEQLRKQGVEC